MSDWASVAFDGIAGALIGSTATIAVVYATIRHDSNAREEDKLDTAVGAAHAGIQSLMFAIHVNGMHHPATHTAMGAALQAVPPAMARARSKEPQLTELLMQATADLNEVLARVDSGTVAQDELLASASRLVGALSSWMADADTVRKGLATYASISNALAGDEDKDAV